MDADWRPQWRVDLIPSYKAHRVAEETRRQARTRRRCRTPSRRRCPIIEAVLDALGIARVGVARLRGGRRDRHVHRAAPPARSTSSPATATSTSWWTTRAGVRVLYPLKGVGTLQITDEAVLREKYGVDGAGYADLALLRGDPSDGLPGVPGIGEKTAAKLLAEFGDLAGIMAAVDDPKAKLTPSQRKRLDESRPYLAVAPKVVRVAGDVPLPDVDTALPRAPRDPAALDEAGGALGAGRLIAAAARHSRSAGAWAATARPSWRKGNPFTRGGSPRKAGTLSRGGHRGVGGHTWASATFPRTAPPQPRMLT